MALEILEQTPDVEAIVVPVGGGGLLAGIGTVVKAHAPDVRVVGVEPEHAACLTAALAAGTPVTGRRCRRRSPTASPSRMLGDAAVRDRAARRRRVVTVDEATIALAILRLIELEKSVVEGAGAAPLAAFLAGKLDALKGKRSCWCCAAATSTSRCSAASSRSASSPTAGSARFTVSISDRPGGLARLAEVIASTGASIKEIVHDRAFSGPDLSAVRVVCVVETTGHAHVRDCTRRSPAAGLHGRSADALSSGCRRAGRRSCSSHAGPTSRNFTSSKNDGFLPSIAWPMNCPIHASTNTDRGHDEHVRPEQRQRIHHQREARASMPTRDRHGDSHA